jgi:hypothetical protein
MSECSICFDPFNKVSRKQVTCPYCSIHLCRSCVTTYVKDEAASPRCVNPECRVGWSEDFLSDNLTKTFLLSEFKACREKVLLDLERARLPETQEDAARHKQATELYKRAQEEIRRIQQELDDNTAYKQAQANYAASVTTFNAANVRYNTEYRETRLRVTAGTLTAEERMALLTPLSTEYSRCRREVDSAQRKVRAAAAPFHRRQVALQTQEFRQAHWIQSNWGKVYPYAPGGQPVRQATENHWSFVMKCPKERCEGFVGKNWRCGLCEVIVCKDCREVIEAVAVGGAGVSKEEAEKLARDRHVCDEEVKQNVAALVKEAKPCPKCAASISKIDGCDQMWCTQCHTAFSWRTGAVEERVHNPHYYEWMRRNGGLAPVPQAAQQMDGCIADNDVIQNVLRIYPRHPTVPQMCRMVRHVDALLRTERRHIRTPESDENKRVLRVKRLLNMITDDEWKDKLQRMEKAVQKGRRVIQVLELFVQASTDLLRQALPVDADRDAICQQVNELRTYCESQLGKIQKRYNNIVPDLSEAELNRMAAHYW